MAPGLKASEGGTKGIGRKRIKKNRECVRRSVVRGKGQGGEIGGEGRKEGKDKRGRG